MATPTQQPAPEGESAPSGATEAVFKISEQVPEGAQKVSGLDFDQFQGKDITVHDLVSNMAMMGFQASGVGEAVRIINDMVGLHLYFFFFFVTFSHSAYNRLDCFDIDD